MEEKTPLTSRGGSSHSDDEGKKKKQFIIIGVVVFLLIAIAISVTLAVVLKKKIEKESLKTRLSTISSSLSGQSAKVTSFWDTYGADPINNPQAGGFYGTLSQSGQPIQPDNKTLTEMSGHLYAYSSLTIHKGAGYKNLAENLYNFTTNSFYNRGLDYGQFFYMVSRDGSTVLDWSFQLFAQSYTLLGLAQYYAATKFFPVDEYFDELFNDIDRNSYDNVYGGYNSSYDAEGNPFPEPLKDAFAHLALMEGVYHIYQQEDPKNPLTYERLLDLVSLFQQRFFIPASNHVHTLFSVDWNAIGSVKRYYGLELSLVHSLRSAARTINQANWTTAVDSLVQKFGPISSKQGFDVAAGGYFDKGDLDGTVTETKKVYWVQAASLLGNWELYEITKDPIYLDRIESTINWIRDHQTDNTYGEWFPSIAQDGSFPDGTNKGSHTKSSFFPVRATVNLPAKINNYIAEEF